MVLIHVSRLFCCWHSLHMSKSLSIISQCYSYSWAFWWVRQLDITLLAIVCTWRLCSFPEIHGRAWWLLRLCKQIFKFEKILHVLPAFRPFFFPKKNNRKHAFCPIWDVKLPLPLCLVSNKWRLLKMTVKKISKFIVFCKLLLGDVKVEISLISSHLLMVFRMRPQPAHSLPPSYVVHIWNKVHLHVTCNSGVLIFEMFS